MIKPLIIALTDFVLDLDWNPSSMLLISEILLADNIDTFEKEKTKRFWHIYLIFVSNLGV
jgi:hypothetical protein